MTMTRIKQFIWNIYIRNIKNGTYTHTWMDWNFVVLLDDNYIYLFREKKNEKIPCSSNHYYWCDYISGLGIHGAAIKPIRWWWWWWMNEWMKKNMLYHNHWITLYKQTRKTKTETEIIHNTRHKTYIYTKRMN